MKKKHKWCLSEPPNNNDDLENPAGDAFMDPRLGPLLRQMTIVISLTIKIHIILRGEKQIVIKMVEF